MLNKSLEMGTVPNEWKSARISAIYNKVPRTDTGNYRPISILPGISKLLEHIVHTQLYQYCIESQHFVFETVVLSTKTLHTNLWNLLLTNFIKVK